ncbi:MAG: hypothetical protein FJ264_00530 [Planctomycetes bacterium]|nr:hypothetical protein [Planctomycetota bacterium]
MIALCSHRHSSDTNQNTALKKSFPLSQFKHFWINFYKTSFYLIWDFFSRYTSMLFILLLATIILKSIAIAGDPENSVFGYHPAAVLENGYSDNGLFDAEYIGVKWTRQATPAYWSNVQPDLNADEYDFDFYDKQWGNVPTSMCIMGCLAPGSGRTLEDSWYPTNEEQYIAFVKATVERYDGDGIDDMPGLQNPIKYWQVGNEFGGSGWSDFADLQKISYQAIKETCPDCTVLLGGIASLSFDYMSRFDEYYGSVIEELNGNFIDIIDIHWYEEADGGYRLKDNTTGDDILDHVRDFLVKSGFPEDMPIWSTEMGTYSGQPEGLPYQTEHQHATDNFKRYIYGLSRGIAKIFQSYGMMEGWQDEDDTFDHTGLIYEGKNSSDRGLGIKKLGYYSYKKMTETLEGADWSTLEMLRDGTDTDLLYLFRIIKDNIPIYIAWWDYFDDPDYFQGNTKDIRLRGIPGNIISITKVVPEYVYGEEITDYDTAFTVYTSPIRRGIAKISLDETPVFITLSQDFDPSRRKKK